MKYLVVSDAHGDSAILDKLAVVYRDQVDALFYCGDSEMPADAPVFKAFRSVRGNCDFDDCFPTEVIAKVGDDRILMVHGHLFNVRFSLNSLSLRAQAVAANLVFFGHTHELGCQVIDGTLFLNPGSISLPRGPIMIPSYAIVESTADAFDVQYYNRDLRIQDQLHQVFKR